jgi:creatinine amidohydrolase
VPAEGDAWGRRARALEHGRASDSLRPLRRRRDGEDRASSSYAPAAKGELGLAVRDCAPLRRAAAYHASMPAPEPTSLFDLPHAEARALLARGVPVYLPVNPVEYHGPHLSLHNDHLVSMGLAADFHARVAPADGSWPFLIAASIEAGVEPCPGPGTRAVSYRALKRLVVDACAALADLGARRVVLMTFHGAPLHAHALDAGVRLLEARGVRALSPFNLLMEEMVDFAPAPFVEAFSHVEDADERAAMLREIPTDFHAGFAETSIALHYAPASVSPLYRSLPPCPPITPDAALAAAARVARASGRARLAAELGFAALGRGWGNLRPFPGYTGRPHRATAAAGALFAERLADGGADAVRRVFAGAPPPRPIMPWIVGATIQGRIPGMAVPLSAVRVFA